MSTRSAAISLLLAAALAAAFGCGRKAPEGGGREAAPVVTGVTLRDIPEEAISDNLAAVGTVKARNSAMISARIPGTVTSLLVKEGDRVPKGKLLLTI